MKELIKLNEQKESVVKIITLSCYSFILVLLIHFVLIQGYSVIAYNSPKELREMNTIALAHHFAYMDNPYSDSVLERDIPVTTSIYGFLVPLLMSPFIRIFSFSHLSALQICELLTLAVELIGIFCFYQLAFKKTKNHLLSLISVFLFHTCYWRYSAFGGAFPDQWGLTLSIILMNLLNTDEQKNRYRPFLYAGCIVGLFYIKQYFVLLVIGLCVYLLVHSMEDLKKLIIYGILLGCLSAVFVYFFFPLYFSEVFPIAHGQTITGDSSYSRVQLIRLSIYYGPTVLFALMRIIIYAYNMVMHKHKRGKITYEFCQIVFVFPPLYLIAENQGTNYTYYLQLWYPYVILYGIVFAFEILGYLQQKCENSLCRNDFKVILSMISSTAVCFLIALSLIKILPFYRGESMTQEQQKAWNNAYNILDHYACDGELLVSMLLSNYCLERGITTSNFGQAEYNNIDNLENYKHNKLWRNIFLFDYTEQLLQQNISYNQSIRDKLYSQSYSCIALVYAGEYHLAEDDLTSAGYHVVASEELISGTQSWHTVFYALTD